jgi:phenylpropionate dioxygenase-like ring-hydroxylating dioxygenase large terminal subunit
MSPSFSPLLDAAALRALKASLDQGYALPSDWYTDKALFEGEREVLRKAWHYAGHTGELSKVGDQVVCRIAGVPVVLVRDEHMQIRGFVNICRHRAHRVVLHNQNQKSMQCLYHGWTYGLDGSLRAAPRAKDEPCFANGEFPLIPVQVAQWGPTLWANVDRDAPSFDEWVPGLRNTVAGHLGPAHYRYAGLTRTFRIRANWKVFMDNAIECYHCATCHPTLAQALEMDIAKQQLSAGGQHWVTTVIPFRKGRNASANAKVPLYYFHWIFPTSYFQYTDDGTGFDIGTVNVIGVDEIEFRAIFFAPEDMPEADVQARMARYAEDPVVGEDIGICERVQEAHEAGLVPPGRLLLNSEWHIQHFQKVIVGMMEGR